MQGSRALGRTESNWDAGALSPQSKRAYGTCGTKAMASTRSGRSLGWAPALCSGFSRKPLGVLLDKTTAPVAIVLKGASDRPEPEGRMYPRNFDEPFDPDSSSKEVWI